MVLPLARTNAEAHLYMDLHACECGETRFNRSSSVITTSDGDLASRYTGTCVRCGAAREFVFRLPAEILMPPADGSIRYGGADPSQLIDPGEWLSVADRYANSVPADTSGLSAEQRTEGKAMMRHAVAAIEEVLKFIPDGAEQVPTAAFTTERGRAVYAKEPGRFRRIRLAGVRDVYREMVDEI